MNKSNILLVTEQDEIEKIILTKLVLLRCSDSISTCSYRDYKKALENSTYSVVILHENETEESTIKAIKTIKEIQNDIEIILLLNSPKPSFALQAYDLGIFDYLSLDSDECDLLIKTVNCYKKQALKDINSRNEKFLYQQGVIDSKTGLYNYKYLKEIFNDLTDNLKIQRGIFAITTLDDSTKTKISTNRLAQTIKNSIRSNDIVAVGKGGKFYIIIPDIDIEGAKNLINKIKDKMGEDFTLRAGLSKIDTLSFDTINKNAQDSLISAIQNDITSACIETSKITTNDWLEDDENLSIKKDFKLFKKLFTSKMENVITPIFYRHQKEFETKLTNTLVSQYVNDIESVFCIKNELAHSELTLRYNGYTKFKIDITHKGLDSAENSTYEIPINELTEKYLKTLFKRLREEYKQSAYKKGE